MLIIFTDLDGTLLNQDDYRYDAAVPVLERLQELKIPVVPVTSKTRAEVELLREELQLTDPFIVENGSGVFVPLDERRFIVTNPQVASSYHLERLGCTYTEAREGLKKISQILATSLHGFGDLTVAEVREKTGLTVAEAQRAKTREFTEPFVTPQQIPADQLKQTVQEQDFQVVVGDRFSHLIGNTAGKGKAVRWLLEQYQSADRIVTVGLGNSPNDLGMLEVVDYPIIIPGNKGPHSGLTGRGWEVAPAPGCQGWAEAVTAIYKRLLP